jgi:hypothetical protein
MLTVGGATQPIEIFWRGGQGYQKISNLAVWHNLANTFYKYSANEPASLLTSNGTNITSLGQVSLGSIQAQQYVYTLSGNTLINNPTGLGAAPLGLLSATNLLNGFSVDDFKQASVKETVWLSADSNLLQRQCSLELTHADTKLNYQALYSYSKFNQPDLTVPVPPNLP